MTSKLGFVTPLKKNKTFIFSHHPSLSSERSRDRGECIQELYYKFVKLNSQVEIEHDLSSLNLLEYPHDNKKVQFDQQMVVAKFKQLQNNAEINRANMELEHRRKKGNRARLHEQELLPSSGSYLNAYKTLIEGKSKQQNDKGEHSDSQEEGQLFHPERVQMKGINYYSQLKRHPKLLYYTLEKVKSRDMINQQQKNAKKRKKENFKNQIIKMSQVCNISVAGSTSNIQNKVNPEEIADNIFRKIYTKKNKQRTISQLRENTRLQGMINKQDTILDNMDDNALSKEKYKKLKGKFHVIVSELYRADKKQRSKKCPSFIHQLNKEEDK